MKSQTTSIGTVITTHRITWNPHNAVEAKILRFLDRVTGDRGGAALLKKCIIRGFALVTKGDGDGSKAA